MIPVQFVNDSPAPRLVQATVVECPSIVTLFSQDRCKPEALWKVWSEKTSMAAWLIFELG